MTISRLSIRSKLILYTSLPVAAVYVVLFWLGTAHVRSYVADDAQQLLTEHARHQASRLALVLSQVPALAESVGDLVIAEPRQSQELRYAHLIDGLRRTPIAKAAGIVLRDPPGGALMRRGAPTGQTLTALDQVERHPGWQINGDMLIFNRAIHRQGQRIGDAWVELAIDDLYGEIERLRSPSVSLFVSHHDGTLLRPIVGSDEALALAAALPLPEATEQVRAITATNDGADYWIVSVELPGFPWRITAVTPTETALGQARREATMFATGLLISLFAIVLIISVAARQITRPLATLNTSVRQIAHGDFAVAPEVTSNDELGGLARAIRRMARHIDDRERQLRRAQQKLEQRVVARTFDLQQSNTRLIQQIEETRKTQEALRVANEQAQQANKAKSEFLSNMSHELRTPLHGVLGYAQILRRDSGTSGSQRESLEAIERCGQHLLTLINDILDLTKIEAGQMRVDIQPTDLPQLLEDTCTIIAQRAAAKGLRVVLDVGEGLPDAILTDPVKLKQILLNLLGNAVKFTVQGEVTLRAAVADPGVLAFEVRDTGVGIPSDKIDAIFDAFNQAREGQAVDGTGLGLAINQRLIQLLGGEPMQVESSARTGSRFSFRLPYKAAAEGALGTAEDRVQAGEGRLQLAAGRHCSVMIIDELAENRKVITSLLRYANCEVEEFADVSSALHRLGERAFDLVVVDVRLPDRDASALVGAVRDQAAFGTPKLLAVSAHVHPDVDRLARKAGFDAFLGKPFNDRQILGRIAELLQIHFEARDEVEAPSVGESEWPPGLAAETARRISEAIEMGDVGSLFQLAEELDANPEAPQADVDNMALMARLFDFDGLKNLHARLMAIGGDAPGA